MISYDRLELFSIAKSRIAIPLRYPGSMWIYPKTRLVSLKGMSQRPSLVGLIQRTISIIRPMTIAISLTVVTAQSHAETVHVVNSFSESEYYQHLYGSNPGAKFGSVVAGAGDVNGDGYDDIVVSAPFKPGVELRVSGVCVVYGTKHGIPQLSTIASIDGRNGFCLEETISDDDGWRGSPHLHISVSGAGDVNADGYDDIVVGMPWRTADGLFRVGITYVVFGKTRNAPIINLANLNGVNGFRIRGDKREDFFGFSVSAAGDVNSDGFDDVIIGSPKADIYELNRLGTIEISRVSAGKSYVVFGAADGIPSEFNVNTLDGTNGFRLDGSISGGNSGLTVSNAGDLNGDVVNDVFIGAPFTDEHAKVDVGAGYVVFGSPLGFEPVIRLSDLDSTDGFRIDGAASGDLLGYSASSAGDINGDGVGDLVLGAPGADVGRKTNAGAVFVVFGTLSYDKPVIKLDSLDGTNGFRINGANANDLTGISVSGIGDINHDSLGDLLIGAPSAVNPDKSSSIGTTYVYLSTGGDTHAETNLDSFDELDGYRIIDTHVNVKFGRSVAHAGFLNSDNAPDVILGAPLADPESRIDAGAALVLLGGLSHLSQYDGMDGVLDHIIHLRDVAGSDLDNSNEHIGSGGLVMTIDELRLVGSTTDDAQGDLGNNTRDELNFSGFVLSGFPLGQSHPIPLLPHKPHDQEFYYHFEQPWLTSIRNIPISQFNSFSPGEIKTVTLLITENDGANDNSRINDIVERAGNIVKRFAADSDKGHTVEEVVGVMATTFDNVVDTIHYGLFRSYQVVGILTIVLSAEDDGSIRAEVVNDALQSAQLVSEETRDSNHIFTFNVVGAGSEYQLRLNVVASESSTTGIPSMSGVSYSSLSSEDRITGPVGSPQMCANACEKDVKCTAYTAMNNQCELFIGDISPPMLFGTDVSSGVKTTRLMNYDVEDCTSSEIRFKGGFYTGLDEVRIVARGEKKLIPIQLGRTEPGSTNAVVRYACGFRDFNNTYNCENWARHSSHLRVYNRHNRGIRIACMDYGFDKVFPVTLP